jgi:hypothetical protein
MFMKKLFFTGVICFFITGAYFPQYQSGYKEGINSISTLEIKKNISFLASDSLKGRFTGSNENLVAALFIANKFKEYGLKEILPQRIKYRNDDDEEVGFPGIIKIEDHDMYKGYLQNFIVESSRLSDDISLSIKSTLDQTVIETKFQYGTDFLIQNKTVKDEDISAPLVFAGFGIPYGENGYNDLIDDQGKEINVKNKIVILMDGFPGERDSTGIFTKSRKPLYRNPLRKAEALAEKGALGIIILQKSDDEPLSIKYENLAKSFKNRFYHLPEQVIKGIPIIFVNRQVSEKLFFGTGLKLYDIIDKINSSMKPAPFEIEGKKISFSIRYQNELIKTQNVIGFVEGTDSLLKKEVIVVGAHYDHVGLGEYGAMDRKLIGQIHNGADDNASGTCGLIELAEALSKSHPKRSILFIAFSAEELGLLGSKYYASFNPVIPLSRTTAMLNLDMIGRNEKDVLWVGGVFYSEDMKSIVEKANIETGFKLLYNTGLLTNASDQAYFFRYKIPAVFFFAGLHDDYHTPRDKVEKLDCTKIENTAKLAYLTACIIGNREQKPEFKELNMEQRIKLVKESSDKQKKIKEHLQIN